MSYLIVSCVDRREYSYCATIPAGENPVTTGIREVIRLCGRWQHVLEARVQDMYGKTTYLNVNKRSI